jgi:hypothetical protein
VSGKEASGNNPDEKYGPVSPKHDHRGMAGVAANGPKTTSDDEEEEEEEEELVDPKVTLEEGTYTNIIHSPYKSNTATQAHWTPTRG